MNKDEVRYMIDQHLGLPRRYTEERDGLEECATGEWVSYVEYKDYVATLKEYIARLESANSQEYRRGYNAGQYAGPDYNMRNN